MMVDYYNLNISEAIKSLKSSENGSTKKEAEKRLGEFGYNELQKEKGLTALTIFLSQFKNALILLYADIAWSYLSVFCRKS